MRSPFGQVLATVIAACGLAALVILRSDFVVMTAIALFFLGALANTLVCALNGWKMPIFLADNELGVLKDDNYCRADANTRCVVLADRFRLPGSYSYSIGDVLMTLALLIMLGTLMLN